MKRTMVMKTVAVLGVASLALAACSSGEETATESATAAESAAETAVEEAETAVETAEEAAAAECQNPSALIVGSLLPATGNLAFLGPPEFAGVEKAIAEIDAAGGVLGAPVTYIEGDSG
ncbi:MAG: amino acid ABC transporter substrate-binding protein, partial [Pontimonas sp.]|nr:amino acid ABC transporter substrate-binding protein [Pontimonas sp.]